MLSFLWGKKSAGARLGGLSGAKRGSSRHFVRRNLRELQISRERYSNLRRFVQVILTS